MPTCRACNGYLTVQMADLGCTPLANAYLLPNQIDKERAYPLEVRVCDSCHLAQVVYVVNPAEIFSDYAYFSSFSTSWLQHASAYCENVTKRESLSEKSLVIEIASNDGYLLQNFVAKNIPVLGIEPAKNIADIANKRGIRTESCFFGKNQAELLSDKYGKANLLVANNVLAHVPDICDLMAGMAHILGPQGLLTIEFPHLLKLLNECQFDTIYHEHYSYLSLTTVDFLLNRNGLTVTDVEEIKTHGGSLRLFINHISYQAPISPIVDNIKEQERLAGLVDGSAYSLFIQKIEQIKQELVEFVEDKVKSGHSIVAYGAAAKGNTLLNYCQLNQDTIKYVTDLNHEKQGKLMPGNHIPIVGPEQLKLTKPDYILILPWNLKQEIVSQLDYCKQWGAKFIVAIPKLEEL